MERPTLREFLVAARRRAGVAELATREIPSTSRRILAGDDHRPPQGRRLGRKRALDPRPRRKGNVDTFAGYWPGTSIEHDRPARRRRNRRTWAAYTVADRRAAVASKAAG